MNSVCYHVAIGAGVREDFNIDLENMPEESEDENDSDKTIKIV